MFWDFFSIRNFLVDFQRSVFLEDRRHLLDSLDRHRKVQLQSIQLVLSKQMEPNLWPSIYWKMTFIILKRFIIHIPRFIQTLYKGWWLVVWKLKNFNFVSLVEFQFSWSRWNKFFFRNVIITIKIIWISYLRTISLNDRRPSGHTTVSIPHFRDKVMDVTWLWRRSFYDFSVDLSLQGFWLL